MKNVNRSLISFISKNIDFINGLPPCEFMTFIAMAMEEWCFQNNENVVEVAREIAKEVERVNKILGKYNPKAPL